MGLIGLVQTLKLKNAVLSWFTIKTTVVGGIVYYTYREGLWSSSEETAKLYVKLYDNVAPYVKDNVPNEVMEQLSKLPSARCISNCARASWNKGVIKSMEFVADLPSHISSGANSLSNTVEKYMKEMSP